MSNPKIPTRLVSKKSTTYGYRGYPRLYIEMVCGHSLFFDVDSRAAKFVPGKTKVKCWMCYHEAEVKAGRREPKEGE